MEATIKCLEEVLQKCAQRDSVVIKPAKGSSGGVGVKIITKEDCDSCISLFSSSKIDLIVQDRIVQHKVLQEIHPSSVNTIRLMTLLFKGQVSMLSAVLRMGVGGAHVDNASAGGITCGIMNDGRLKSIAFDKYGNKYTVHLQGTEFGSVVVPGYEAAKNMAIQLAQRLPYCAMLSWDIAIGFDGSPILIEVNMNNGELDFHQFNNDPIFGEITNEVVKSVMKNL